jgi:hypothetical protein
MGNPGTVICAYAIYSRKEKEEVLKDLRKVCRYY